MIITGSSDSTVRVWDVKTGAHLNTLMHHSEAVLHLRYYNGIMVTCSKDRSIAVWDMTEPYGLNGMILSFVFFGDILSYVEVGNMLQQFFDNISVSGSNFIGT